MTTPSARTLAEAYLYVTLVLEGQQPVDYRDLARSRRAATGGWTVEVDGEYNGRRYRFGVPVDPAPPGETPFGRGHYGWGREASTLIDPGGWRHIEFWYGPPAEEAALALGEVVPPAEEYGRIREGLHTAAAALGELAKFLPSGADEVPAAAFFTDTGRRYRELTPDAFRRDRIDRDRRRYQELLDGLDARWDAARPR